MTTKISRSAKVVTVLALTLGLLAGCGGNTTNKPEDTGQPAASTNDNDLSPVTFSFFGADPNPNWNKMQDDVGKEITKLTGVTLDAEFPVGDASQKVALIATSGQYPDLISPKAELNKLVDAGAMLDLTDLIDKHAPNIKKMLGDQIKRLRYSNDDKSIYVIPTYSAVDQVNFVAAGGFSLQHRAVKEAGYPPIKTLQDYENVIKSYLDKHPTNENGDPNIGLTLNADDWHTYISVTNPAADSTGKAGDGEWYIDPKTYEATYHYRTEGEKDYFKWLNHMFNTGLLDKDTFVQKSDQYNAKIASGRVIGLIDADWSFGDGLKSLKKDGKFDQTYGYFPVMLSDKYKDNRLQSTGFMAGWGVGITTSCKDPVRAIKFLDFLASEKGQILNNWGVEGKQYIMENGKRVVPADVQNRINNDNTAFSKESGIGFYGYSLKYGDGVKDSTGNYYTKNFPELIVQGYSDTDKQTLQAYGAKTYADLFTPMQELPVKPWGAAWNLSVPADDEVSILQNKMKDITWKRIPQAIMAKPDQFDKIWDDYQQDLIKAGVEKMEKGFTKYVQDRVKLWNE
ncbi:ABC transporter substrate-binding protein [Paenibacillus sp. sptzw28]|uniref:ABC transporter substrate-binding protein n=1 Tax=Paenibacillus sp. sptzw28 TaxID=715179 RepID=UPI001C6E212D|nr:ABC transporter substrate-binding protein [Paenibacillus sp. sptzw28]QYR23088.1 ABC transporter substrate-binding protein [Paenibacillus sp. sptzw28]